MRLISFYKNITKKALGAFILFTFIALPIFATMPKFFSTRTIKVVKDAEQENTMLSEDHTITLAPETTKLSGIEEPQVWEILASSTGEIFATTGGNKGRVYRMGKGEDSFTKIIETEEKNITSIDITKNGKIYVSTAPDAYVYVYNSDLSLETKIKIDNTYIWDMGFDKNGILYLATGGDKSAVFTIDRKYDVKEILSLPTENHIMTLYYNNSDNSFYAGTEGNGLLIKFDANTTGDYDVIYDTGEKEVHSVVVDDDGNVYFGTANREKNDMLSAMFFGTEGNSKAPKSFRNSIYKADSRGAVHRIFYLTQMLVFSLIKDDAGNIYFATGDKSALYRVEKDGTLLYVSKFDDKSIVTSTATMRYIYFASKTGDVYKMSKSFSREGTFTSSVLDTGFLSSFGSVDYLAEMPLGSSIIIETRTGNISKPDKTWSDFKALDSVGKIQSPSARFIQYRIKLTTADTKYTPEVTSMIISYLTENIAPTVLKARLLTKNTQPTVDIAAYKKPALKVNQSMLIWAGKDPNGDKLMYSVEYKLRGESVYRPFVENIATSYFIFDSIKLPSAIYDFKITATDYLDNGIEQAREKTILAPNLKYDITPPYILGMEFADENDMKKASFTVHDDLSMIKSVRMTTFDGLWQYITPVDKMIDGKYEHFSILIEDENAQSITLEVVDIEGNIAYYSYVI